MYGATASECAGVSGILVTPSRLLQLRLFDILGNQLDANVTVQAGSLVPVTEGAMPVGQVGELKRFK